MKFFLDTYAIFEIIKGNPNYEKYLDSEIVTLKQNLAELSYGYIKLNKKELAAHYFKKYSKKAVELPINVILKAMQFRYENKDKKFSYIDCLGYIYAKKYGFRFLTGDEEFKNIANVEFVK